MNWNNIISARRTGDSEDIKDIRSNFQRDYDRLIFSSAFRRLQNKTQIFPLPGSVFVHNRLTHSLEVASVGRSLGKITGDKLCATHNFEAPVADFYRLELQNVIASACLAHDIGNPPFGHSGENAISSYFTSNAKTELEGKQLSSIFSEKEWADLTNFEGNANSIRVMTKEFKGKSEGGYNLTYTTLASIMKYPCESVASNKKFINRKKFGFFQTEKERSQKILQTLNVEEESTNPLVFKRHPFVYLTEAADDICYRIVDFEDAQRLNILSHDNVCDSFLTVIESIGRDNMDKVKSRLDGIQDKNERTSYLRAKCINVLTIEASELFFNKQEDILNGTFNYGLIDYIEQSHEILKEISNISVEKIYNHETVVQLEIAGYKVMSDLLGLFIPAVLCSSPNLKEKKILQLIPEQFHVENDNAYEKVMAILDYLSGMTDSYIIELYRKLFGIEIPRHL